MSGVNGPGPGVSSDLPGARLLDVVATMDRLRSPGGCPWDAQQTHASLAPYLLEEAYEAVDAIERDDPEALRDELGDVLLQVVFHARLAEERSDGTGWGIDDVAVGLVEKLVRRHPHVFADREITGVAEVLANWETIKATESRRTSAVDGVPLGAPALSVAAKLQHRAAALGLPAALVSAEVAATETLPQAVAGAAAALEEDPSSPVEQIGELLFAVVALARFHDVDPEAALRGTARRFRDRLVAVERSAEESGTSLRELDAPGWETAWSAGAEAPVTTELAEAPGTTEPPEPAEPAQPAEPTDEELSAVEEPVPGS